MNYDDETKSRQNGNRRTALKSILVGSGVVLGAAPSKWMKPVVETVVLPAHAQTSPAGGGGGGRGAAGGGAGIPMMGARAPFWLDKLVPRAHAQSSFPSGGQICISEDDFGGFTASWVDSEGTVRASGVFSVPDCAVLLCPGDDFGAVLNVTEALSNGRFRYEFRMGSAGDINELDCTIDGVVLLNDSGITSFECDVRSCR